MMNTTEIHWRVGPNYQVVGTIVDLDPIHPRSAQHKCRQCGQTIDARLLCDVVHHARPGHMCAAETVSDKAPMVFKLPEPPAHLRH